MKDITLAGYAIVPDGYDQPTAVFADLQQAIEWALSHLGSNRFTIRAHPQPRVAPGGPPRGGHVGLA